MAFDIFQRWNKTTAHPYQPFFHNLLKAFTKKDLFLSATP